MGPKAFETDTIGTAEGDLQIIFLGHGPLLFTFRGRRICVDPFSRVAGYAILPKVDLILITHEHRDHLDPEVLGPVRTSAIEIVCTELCRGKVEGGIGVRNGEAVVASGLRIEAVLAYNLVYRRDTGKPFHPRGEGNIYLIEFGNVRVLIAGDTGDVPELKALWGVDMAFLPMNLPTR